MPEEHRDLANNRELDPHLYRARTIVASLRTGEPSSAEVFEAFWQLDELPVDAVRDALVPWTGPLPDLDRLDSATRLAHGLPLRPLRLQTLSVTRDADVLDQGPIAEEQLRLAGKSWDGADLPAEERLDGEVEGSFAGTLERRVLADVEAPEAPTSSEARNAPVLSARAPLYDVLLFAENAGIVFAAGTTTVVALIAYGKVEMRDRRTRVALEEAIATPAAVAPSVALEADETSTATPSEQTEETAAREEAPKKSAEKKPKKAPKIKTAERRPPKKTGAKTGAKKKTAAAKSASAKKPAKKATAIRAKKKPTAAKSASARKPAKKATATRAKKKATAARSTGAGKKASKRRG